MNIVKKLQEMKPERNVVFTAIESLGSREEIKQFHQEYREYMVDEGFTHEVADSNIGYVLGYYEKDTRNSWNELLDIVHPIFGKTY